MPYQPRRYTCLLGNRPHRGFGRPAIGNKVYRRVNQGTAARVLILTAEFAAISGHGATFSAGRLIIRLHNYPMAVYCNEEMMMAR